MPDSIVDATDKLTIAPSCGCAAVLRPDRYEDAGVSFFFCAAHSRHGVAVVYDSKGPVPMNEPFAWDYTRNPS